jgi:hypothetical protein
VPTRSCVPTEEEHDGMTLFLTRSSPYGTLIPLTLLSPNGPFYFFSHFAMYKNTSSFARLTGTFTVIIIAHHHSSAFSFARLTGTFLILHGCLTSVR